MRKYKNKNKKRYNGIPCGIDRMDKELLSEIKLYYSLTNSIEATAKAYHVSSAMVKYAIERGSSFDELQKQIIKEES